MYFYYIILLLLLGSSQSLLIKHFIRYWIRIKFLFKRNKYIRKITTTHTRLIIITINNHRHRIRLVVVVVKLLLLLLLLEQNFIINAFFFKCHIILITYHWYWKINHVIFSPVYNCVNKKCNNNIQTRIITRTQKISSLSYTTQKIVIENFKVVSA